MNDNKNTKAAVYMIDYFKPVGRNEDGMLRLHYNKKQKIMNLTEEQFELMERDLVLPHQEKAVVQSTRKLLEVDGRYDWCAVVDDDDDDERFIITTSKPVIGWKRIADYQEQ